MLFQNLLVLFVNCSLTARIVCSHPDLFSNRRFPLIYFLPLVLETKLYLSRIFPRCFNSMRVARGNDQDTFPLAFENDRNGTVKHYFISLFVDLTHLHLRPSRVTCTFVGGSNARLMEYRYIHHADNLKMDLWYLIAINGVFLYHHVFTQTSSNRTAKTPDRTLWAHFYGCTVESVQGFRK